MDFAELSKERYSCRKFSDRKVEPEKVDVILQAITNAPTAVNRQPFHVWVVESENRLDDLKECTPYTFNAPCILIFGYKESEAYVRKYDGKNFADIDATIAGTHAMLEIHDLGLGATWVGHFDPAKVAERFPETEGYTVTALFPLGYPADDAVPSERHTVRRPAEEMYTRL